MSWVHSQEDFEGGVYTAYRDYPFFLTRAGEMNGRWNAIKNQKVLIAGCGYGYLVKHLMEDFGFTDVWGVDASEYAVANAPDGYTGRVLLGDVLDSASMDQVKAAAGLSGGQRFRACLTEDLLPCAENDGEVDAMLTNLRAISQVVAHAVTPYQEDTNQIDGMLWKSVPDWKALVNNELVINAVTGEVA